MTNSHNIEKVAMLNFTVLWSIPLSKADFPPQDMLLKNLGWVLQRTHKAHERSFLP